MAKVVLLGASGEVGSRILKELSDRGHFVTAIARNANRIASLPRVSAVSFDLCEYESLAKQLQDHDVIVSSVNFSDFEPKPFIAAVLASGVKRYISVGGAGSLEVEPGQLLFKHEDFPKEYLAEATLGATYLEFLKQQDELDWTFLSPSAFFFAGERTGKFRLGKDSLLRNDQGSRISYEDYAIAMVDEIEEPKHSRRRFTVGY